MTYSRRKLMPSFDAVGVIVADMAEALAFYRQLGLAIPEAANSEDHVEVKVAAGFRLMFDTIEVIERFTTYHPPAGGRGVGFAFRCSSPEEVDELYSTITAMGYESKQAPFDAFWGQRYATLLDPNGNPVDLYAPIPAETPSIDR
jgi:uncharacterized glyoxalase superfamily protein PhnB